MINTLQELLEDYARFSCLEDRIDNETSEELQKGVKDYLKQLNELNLLTIPDVVGQSEQLCDFLEWYDEALTLEEREMDVKTYVEMKSHNCLRI